MNGVLTALLCSALLLPAAAGQSAQVDQSLAVHVRPKPVSVGGFLEPVNADIVGIADRIKHNLRRYKWVSLVDSPDAADVVLSVAARRVDQEEVGAGAMPFGGMVLAVPITSANNTVTVELSAGDYTRPLTAAAGSLNRSTDAVTKDAVAWITANAATLRSRRADRR
jgi:hypothetical protein